MKVVIVGGVAGGATADARIRRLDENAEIIFLKEAVMFLMQTEVCLITTAEKFMKRKNCFCRHPKVFGQDLKLM